MGYHRLKRSAATRPPTAKAAHCSTAASIASFRASVTPKSTRHRVSLSFGDPNPATSDVGFDHALGGCGRESVADHFDHHLGVDASMIAMGAAVAARCEQFERADAWQVIMITAHAEPDLEAKAAASGAVCLLRKPFETDALIDCLERAASA